MRYKDIIREALIPAETYIDGKAVPGVRDEQGNVRPPTVLYRVMSPQEWAMAQQNGFLGPKHNDYVLHASIDKPHTKYANPGGHVIVEITYDPADDWRAKWGSEGVEAISRNKIPLSRVKPILKEIMREAAADIYRFADDVKKRLGLLSFQVTPGHNELILGSIVVPPGSKGRGTLAMQEMTKFADQHCLPIRLVVAADESGKSDAKLISFYEKFGFRKRGVAQMRREPASVHDPELDEATVLEGRDASLYHATKLDYALAILAENRIAANTTHVLNKKRVAGVSLTRSWNLATSWGKVVLELNQSSITKRHKLIPVSATGMTGEKKNNEPFIHDPDSPWSTIRQHGERLLKVEAEEFCVGPIAPLSAYLIKVHMLSGSPEIVAFCNAHGIPYAIYNDIDPHNTLLRKN